MTWCLHHSVEAGREKRTFLLVSGLRQHRNLDVQAAKLRTMLLLLCSKGVFVAFKASQVKLPIVCQKFSLKKKFFF